MIAVVALKTGRPCIVKLVGRKGLKVRVVTYCGGTADAAQGVAQVPDDALLCEKCKQVLRGGA